MAEDLEVIAYLQENLAPTSFLSPLLSASWSLIHLNLILIASNAVGQPGRVLSLMVKLAFGNILLTGRTEKNMASIFHGYMSRAPLHFN